MKVCTVVYGRMVEFVEKYMYPSLEPEIKHLGCEFKIYATPADFFKEEHGDYVFYASPDHVYSKNTLTNCFKLTKFGDDIAVAIPHFRVNEHHFIEAIKHEHLPIDSKRLMDIGIKTAHQNFATSEVTRPENSRHCGVGSLILGHDMIAVQHSLPTVACVKFTDSDREFFRNNGYRWGEWDRAFLEKLHKEGRVGIVGSSDIACCVEMTEHDSHFVCLKNNTSGKHAVNDSTTDLPHNLACRQTIFAIRR